MSNKLVKLKVEKSRVNENKKRIIFLMCLIVLSIAFIFVWANVFLTSKNFEEKMNNMVLGVDYFVEDIIITDKRVETDVNNAIHENYFFYYRDGRAYDYDKRMEVSGKVYSEYEVGDIISAYTTNHKEYSYKKYGILPKNEFINNELMKCVGVLLGIGIFTLIFFRFLDKKALDFQK